jgi:hypothetical protein
MTNSIVSLVQVFNENCVRANINQLSAFSVELMFDGKVDEKLRNQLSDLIQKMGDTQREISVLLGKMANSK